MYYELQRELINGKIGNLVYESLKLELRAIEYEIYADRTVKVVSKEAIKKQIGKSPYFADSLVFANWVNTYRGVWKWDLPIAAGD
jgi:hypothetical protein